MEAGFTFELPHAIGRGYFRLRQDMDGTWKALAVSMMVKDLKGHEEPVGPRSDWESKSRYWEEVDQQKRGEVEGNPYVLIGEYVASSQITC